MSVENLFNNPPQETPKPEEKKLEQPIQESNAEEQNLSEEQEEQYKQWMKDHPETVIAPEDLRECGPEIAEFEEMLTSFEIDHSLAELHLIIDLKPEDAPKYPLRESAKVTLIPIVAKLNILKKETNITPEKHEELKAKYMQLSRAVGMINNNKVDHNR
ncbi:MAG: hypothetical protein V1712_03195 [Patescibacteria group bacterium]